MADAFFREPSRDISVLESNSGRKNSLSDFWQVAEMAVAFTRAKSNNYYTRHRTLHITWSAGPEDVSARCFRRGLRRAVSPSERCICILWPFGRTEGTTDTAVPAGRCYVLFCLVRRSASFVAIPCAVSWLSRAQILCPLSLLLRYLLF